jgi:hypothetical protein
VDDAIYDSIGKIGLDQVARREKHATLKRNTVKQKQQNEAPHVDETSGYSAQAFALDWEKHVATCPQGQESHSWTHHVDKDQKEEEVIRFATISRSLSPHDASRPTDNMPTNMFPL